MKKNGKRLSALIMSFAMSAFIMTAMPMQGLAYTETTGTVSSDNVKVRSSANTTASQVTSLGNGDSVQIVDETTDASGYTWYKVKVGDSSFGYVRSDLVTKSEGDATATTTTDSIQENAAAASLPATTATAVDGSTGTVISDSVNVRAGAGTTYDSVGKVKNGDVVSITGQASDADGNTWYEVTFGDGGTKGYIRNDFLQVTEAAAPADTGEAVDTTGADMTVAEGDPAAMTDQPADESAGDSAVASEAGDGHYSLVYSTEDSAEGIWYLYDNVEGYRVKVNELIDAAKSSDAVNKLVKTNNTYKTILIILGVVIAALIVGLVIMALKLRDSLYYEDDDDEYDQFAKLDPKKKGESAQPKNRPAAGEGRTVRPASRDDGAARPQRQPVRRPEDQDERTVRPRRVSPEVQQDRPVRRPADDRTVRPTREEVESRRVPRDGGIRRNTVTPDYGEAPRRKTKNFAGDQDDFEFEFLDLDDKE